MPNVTDIQIPSGNHISSKTKVSPLFPKDVNNVKEAEARRLAELEAQRLLEAERTRIKTQSDKVDQQISLLIKAREDIEAAAKLEKERLEAANEKLRESLNTAEKNLKDVALEKQSLQKSASMSMPDHNNFPFQWTVAAVYIVNAQTKLALTRVDGKSSHPLLSS